MKKTPLVILIAVAVVAVAYGAYWYAGQEQVPPVTPTEEAPESIPEPAAVSGPEPILAQEDSPTGAWDKYVNEGFYSIYYPKDWCRRGGSSADFTSSSCGRSPVPMLRNELQVSIDLLDLADSNITTLEDWLKVEKAFDVQETVLDGERAVWAKSKSSFGDTHITLVALRKGTFYLIQYSPSDSELKGVFDTMLGSFRFAR